MSTMRVRAAAGLAALALVGLGASAVAAPTGPADPADPTAPGDHVPLSVEPRSCTSIPSTHDSDVIRIVYQVGLARDVSEKVLLAAFEAGWVESHMNNLPCGHKDSLGVFQQRPGQGWGTPEQVSDVTYAATQFYDRAQRNESTNPEYTAGLLAQSVQRSCCPERYDEAEDKASPMISEARALAGAGEATVAADARAGRVAAALRGGGRGDRSPCTGRAGSRGTG